ncbi:MAG: flagellar biosynthesis anti-sigma factor FlgM [Synergistaceae bacterium]|jgi:anti-sigma28 factor (negative regulator of flagellin synthesis)|nr:flagellar biosynthesis anti-sigma factor FlgM [Synergistaceae bacterium]
MIDIVEKTRSLYGASGVSGSRASTYSNAPAETGEKSDEAEFSPFAVELARAMGTLKDVPDVREDAVEEIKGLVEVGEYNPPLEQVAYSLYLAGVLNPE